LASAYTAFANAGVRVEPNVIARITDSSGKDVVNETPRTRTVVEPATAYMITDMLSDVIDHGTASVARGSVKQTAIAGKTGTSRDGWFVGYTPNLVVAVWIGFDDNTQLGLTGAKAALPAWVEFVRGAVEMRPELGGENFTQPEGIVHVEIDPQTGGLASLSCPQRETIAIAAALAPNVECFLHVDTSLFVDAMGASQFSNKVSSSVNEETMIVPSHTGPVLRPSTEVGASILDLRGTTRMATNFRGRPVLINDMRVDSR